ncbi:unnamed protein product, partial [Chrysoparadoxa australica]
MAGKAKNKDKSKGKDKEKGGEEAGSTRAKSAFQFFCDEQNREIKEKGTSFSGGMGARQKAIGEKWAALTDKEKAKFTKLAEKDKKRAEKLAEEMDERAEAERQRKLEERETEVTGP